MQEELKSCPFCGGPAKEMMGLVGCEPCALARRDAATWNRRAPAPSASEAQPVAAPANGWLRDGSMVYRLTDERRPSNTDEISVTMVDGSRDLDRRKEQAERIRLMLSDHVAVLAEMPELGSTVVNDAAWKFVEAMPHRIPGPIWNDLKPALYAALQYFHGHMAAPSGPAREPLTDEQIQDLLQVGDPTRDECRLIRLGWDAAHGITAAQQGDKP